ncbi:LysE family translocator [Magnetospira thiophila]
MPDLLLFLVASLIIALTPGPSWIYVISRTLAQGPAVGIVAVAGNTTGIAVHTLAVALGLSLILRQSETAFMILKGFGVLYLIYLGLRTLNRGFGPRMETPSRKRSLVIFVEAVGVNVTNPKVALLFLALLPQFVDPMEPPLVQMLMLGAVHMAVATTVTLGLVLLARRLRAALGTGGRLEKMFRWGAGGALLLLAGRLAFAVRG